jgi:hypothetical protein
MNLTGTGYPPPDSSGQRLENRGGSRARLAICAIAFTIALVYVGGVFYTRRQQDRELAAQAAARQREMDQEAVQFMGGDRFEILNFYANPQAIRRGEDAELCYGVSHAKTVTLTPAVGAVWPAFSRCLQVAPQKTTSFTLTAVSSSGEAKTATAKIEVR